MEDHLLIGQLVRDLNDRYHPKHQASRLGHQPYSLTLIQREITPIQMITTQETWFFLY